MYAGLSLSDFCEESNQRAVSIGWADWAGSVGFGWTRPLDPKIQGCWATPGQSELDPHIREPMQICIHQKDNSPKLVNHRLNLKEGPKVKSEHTTRFPAHDFL